MTRKNSGSREIDTNRVSMVLDAIKGHLSAISDREFQLRLWYRAEGPGVDWYEERMLSFETGIECFESLLREGQTSLDSAQVKAILRVFIMDRHFSKILQNENVPEGWSEEQLYIINHPYWLKIQRQAAHALSLLKLEEKNSGTRKPLRTYGNLKTRTADRRPNLDDRFADRMKIFSDIDFRRESWKNRDDFWEAVNRFDIVTHQFFDGRGGVSSGWLFKALMAFQKALDKLCKPYEEDGGDLTAILSDPHLQEVEEKARNFLKIIEERPVGP